MTRLCPELAVLDAASTPEGVRREVLAHVAGCARCRDAWIDEDPTRLFALLALTEIPEATLAAVSAGVAAAIDAGEAPSPRRWVTGTGWAAAAALAVLAVRVLVHPFAPEQTVALESAGSRPPRAEVEVLAPLDAKQIVDLTVGESQVVMIFDERVKL